MDILVLVVYTVAAWLVHLALAGVYVQWFSSPKTPAFRLAHAVEIGLLVIILLHLYNGSPGQLTTVVTMVVTLAVLDTAYFSIFKSLLQKIDAFHFAAAYSVIIVLSVLLSK